ncbi:hypothetical protein HPP92_014268 [Vanilla planifolia]|uniref:Uncharacterized protein n=1 Tax=Vanilla planifolia TaxID=51239 RepID=A0A835QVH8_VANPL|nr:hypothetical protein HPP92_014682 [Vanilla planifolia]KAG0474582.1 hypothetical protein HPP92_014268 [Vanilla planifolia]
MGKIQHIVKLRQLLRRWRTKARRSAGEKAATDVPIGHVAICVGSCNRRYVVRTAHLNHPAFRILLNQAEEEYGFSNLPGPLSLPCDESLFLSILRQISSSDSSHFPTSENFEIPAARGCLFLADGESSVSGDALPLLQGNADKPVR